MPDDLARLAGDEDSNRDLGDTGTYRDRFLTLEDR